MSEGKLTETEVVILATWLVLGTGLLALPAAVAHFTIHDSWMAMLSMLGGCALSAGLVQLFHRVFPGQTLAQACQSALGNWLGRGAQFLLAVFLFLFVGMLVRELGDFVSTTVLPNTPYYVLTAVFMVSVAYGVSSGPKTIGQVGEFSLPLVLLGMLMSLIAIQRADWEQIRPVLGGGLSPVLRASVLPVLGFSSQFVLFAQGLPRMAHPERAGRDLLIAGALVGLIAVLFQLMAVTILGPSLAYLGYPILEIVRSIRAGEYIERFDTFYVMGIVIVVFIKVAWVGWTCLDTIRDMLRAPRAESLAWSGCALAWIGSLVGFHDDVDLVLYIIYTAPALFAVFLYGLPMVVLLVGWLRARGGGHPRQFESERPAPPTPPATPGRPRSATGRSAGGELR